MASTSRNAKPRSSGGPLSGRGVQEWGCTASDPTGQSPVAHSPAAQPRMKTHTQTIIINFGDDATTWFREISAAVQAGPRSINVQFVGGACPPAFETISLRNMLLQIPGHIKLTTTAACSLPPLTCAAWMVGDERHIARDAVVWIPQIPADLMNGFPGSSSQNLGELQEHEIEDEDAEGITPFDEPIRRPRNALSRSGYTMGGSELSRTFVRFVMPSTNGSRLGSSSVQACRSRICWNGK
jgi:hypothetical protein